MNIRIREIKPRKRKFIPIGEWWFGDHERNLNDDGPLQIVILKMPNPLYFFIAVMHVLIEVAWCLANEVSQTTCHAFIVQWEEEMEQGLHLPPEEAGLDKRCPYRKGHVWGNRFARLSCWALGVKWKTYSQYFYSEPDKLP